MIVTPWKVENLFQSYYMIVSSRLATKKDTLIAEGRER